MPTSRFGTTSRLDIFVLSSIRLFQSNRSMVLTGQNESKTILSKGKDKLYNMDSRIQFFYEHALGSSAIIRCYSACSWLALSEIRGREPMCRFCVKSSLIKQLFLPRGSQLLSCKPVLNVLLGTKFNQSLLQQRGKYRLGVFRPGCF